MAFEFYKLFELAKQLHENGSEEAHFRSSIGRSYYALYNCAKIYAINYLSYVDIVSSSAHQRLIAHFKDKSEKCITNDKAALKEIHDALSKSFQKRKDADYDKDKIIDKNDAQNIYKQCKKAFTMHINPKGIT